MEKTLSILEIDPIWKTRNNHALEHATLNILSSKVKTPQKAGGLSDPNGFWIIGNLEIEELVNSVQTALKTLKEGQSQLAFHENCGSNLAPRLLLSGLLAGLVMAGTGSNMRKKARRFPLAVILGMIGFEAGRPFGPKLQENTVSIDHIQEMSIKEIRLKEIGNQKIFRVDTEFESA